MQETAAVQYTKIVCFEGTKRDCTVGFFWVSIWYDVSPKISFCKNDAKPSSVG